MSFLYPRTVAITRPPVNDTPGDRGYSGLTEGSETPVASGLPASIQLASKGGSPDADVPADAYSRVTYDIFVPARAAALGLIDENDVATDDLGKRYQIIGAYWNSLGYNLTAVLLKP